LPSKCSYELFLDREDCFLAAFEEALSAVQPAASRGFIGELRWQDGIRAALAAILASMDADRGLARLCVVEACAAGERVSKRRRQVLAELADAVDRGRSSRGASTRPSPLGAEGVVGAAFTVLHTRLLEERSEPLTALLGPLMSMIVLPYLGASAAERELTRPAPAIGLDERPVRPVGIEDPLAGLNMRLTYRTVRVLGFISEHPGAGNREIAGGAGITDAGQISKLLSRLARLNLAENLGERQGRGATNAWQLTERGALLERATRRQR
jgi:hypothetical protein